MLNNRKLQMEAYLAMQSLGGMKVNEVLVGALELIYEVMSGQVNAEDECEKFLREYAPGLLAEDDAAN